MARQRPIVINVHFNRQKAAQGLPWTVHTSRSCSVASRVVMLVPGETIHKPEKRSNPRGWLRFKGIVRWEGTVAFIESP